MWIWCSVYYVRSQLQFLSHQSKISSKLELFTAKPNPNVRCHEEAKFTRLGYLSLDSNERSQFQARELKSVYVDVPVSYVKILLHKCYVNKFNLVNQVGLVALNCIGRHFSDDEIQDLHNNFMKPTLPMQPSHSNSHNSSIPVRNQSDKNSTIQSRHNQTAPLSNPAVGNQN